MPTKTKKTAKRTLRHHVHQSFVPHKTNNYQPHLVRWYGIALLIAVVFVIQGFYNMVSGGTVLGRATTISPATLLKDTNNERIKRGEQPLASNAKLNQAAYEKASDMFTHQYWAHVSPDGVQPWQWFDNSGYEYKAAGENLAKGFHTSGAVMTAWMNSTEHKENILDTQYQDVGFAVLSGKLYGKDTTLVVALYGDPITNSVAASARTSPNPTVAAPVQEDPTIAANIGVTLMSITPAALASIVLLLIAIIVALAAHLYRNKLPKQLRKSWYRHHGLYKAAGMASLLLLVVILYGGGQI